MTNKKFHYYLMLAGKSNKLPHNVVLGVVSGFNPVLEMDNSVVYLNALKAFCVCLWYGVQAT